MASPSQNTSQKITIFSGFVGDFINTFISIFSLFFIPLTIPLGTFTITTYTIFTVNTLCFLSFIFLFLFEIKRELWLINHLDYSKRYSSLHLSSYKDQYPHLFDQLSTLNVKYFLTYRIVRIAFYINFLTTSTALVYLYYLSS